MSEVQAKKSDLGVRALSAVVMVAVAGSALWLGDWFWTLFIAAVGAGVLWEWLILVRGFVAGLAGRTIWLIAGMGYIGLAAFTLVQMRLDNSLVYGEYEYAGLVRSLLVILVVVAVDVGAYFLGRSLGGPKIAPKISPSKTWAGFVGGVLGASLVFFVYRVWVSDADCGILAIGDSCEFPSASAIGKAAWGSLLAGLLAAFIAQAGDFFESWMKRSAGVKDSGKLIPGHGGLFDRVDGLLAVCFAVGVLNLAVVFYLSGQSSGIPQ